MGRRRRSSGVMCTGECGMFSWWACVGADCFLLVIGPSDGGMTSRCRYLIGRWMCSTSTRSRLAAHASRIQARPRLSRHKPRTRKPPYAGQ